MKKESPLEALKNGKNASKKINSTNLIDAISSQPSENIALVTKKIKITYGELDTLSNQLAHFLELSVSIKKDDVVAVISDNSPQFVILILSVWKLGAVVVLLDSSLQNLRIQSMLESAKVSAVIGHKQSHLDKIDPAFNPVLINLKEIKKIKNKSFNAYRNAYQNKISCIFFTSGTTGKPKGILYPHESILHFIQWQKQCFSITERDKCLQITRLSFDVILRSVLTALISGASLFFPDTRDELASLDIIQLLESEKITYFHVVPSLMKTWLLLNEKKYSGESLRYIFFAGEKLDGELVNKTRSTISSERITYVNLYGPSELVLAKFYYLVKPKDEQRLYPVGKPLPKTAFYLVSKNQLIKDINQKGEIVIDTHYRSLGYLDHSSMLKKIPTLKKQGYFTGDIGYIDENKNLYVLGRVDDQIKINGVRIELNEIDITLSEYPHIEQAATLYEKKTKKLKAYLLLKSKINIIDLRTFLEKRLMPEMIPHQFYAVTHFLYNHNGKLDKKKLSTLDSVELMTDKKGAKRKNETELEKQLCLILGKIFDSPISLSDNFFSLGAGSLSAAIAVYEINRQMNVKITIRDIFSHSNFNDLAVFLSEKKKLIALEGNINPVVFSNQDRLTPEQLALATHQLMNPYSASYNVGYAFKFKAIDEACLYDSIVTLFKKHPILRSIIIDNGENLIYERQESFDQNISKIALQTSDDPQNHLNAVFSEPFNLRKQLIKVQTVHHKNDIYLLVVFHHAITDGESSELFFKELESIYSEKPSIIAPSLLSSSNNNHDHNKKFWDNYLLNYPKTRALPSCGIDNKNGHSRINESSGTMVVIDLPSNLVDNIRICSENTQTTHFSIYLALFSILIHEFGAGSHQMIAIPFSNRAEYQTFNQLGCYVKTLPFIAKLDSRKKLIDIINETTKLTLDLLDHSQGINIGKLINEINEKAEIDAASWIDLFFSYNESYYDILNLGRESGQRVDLYNNTSKFSLSFMLNKLHNQHLKLEIEFDNRIFNEQQINALTESYAYLLQNVNTLLHQPIRDIQYLSHYDNKNHHDYEWLKENIIDIISKKMHAKNNAIAIEDDRGAITYAELENKVTDYVNLLSMHSLPSNAVVAVLLPRSIESVALMLAIWTKGCIYLPIDHEAPLERIKIVLDGACPNIVIGMSNQAFSNLSKEKSDVFIDLATISLADNKNFTQDTKREKSLAEPAYLLYTSGSTGQPKGVLQTHQTLLNLFYHQSSELPYNTQKTIAQCASAFFDVSIQEMIFALGNGHKLFIFNKEDKLNPLKFWSMIVNQKINVLFIPPALLQVLAEFYNPEIKPELEAIVVAGEALKITSAIKTLFKQISSKLINHYGPTETHVVTSHVLENDPDLWPILPSIGKSLENCGLFILDQKRHPVVPGEKGELYISGANLAIGYYKNQFLTHEKFVYHHIDGKLLRMYQTGDLVSMKGELLYFHSRLDHQINLHGFRIEPHEIEMALQRNQSIKKSYVCVKNLNSSPTLIAYYTSVDAQPLAIEQLHEIADRFLPAYMRPVHYVFLDHFPLTINGKINTTGLPLPEVDLLAEKRNVQYTPIQQHLLDIINNTIKSNHQLSTQKNILSLKIDSLALARILSKIALEFEIDMGFSDLYLNNTLEKLEQYINNHANKSKISSLSSLPLAAKNIREYPPSPQQFRILNDIKRGQSPASHNLGFSIELKGEIDYVKLEKSLTETLNNHDIFKTTLIPLNLEGYEKLKNDEIFCVSDHITSSVEILTCKEHEINDIINNALESELHPFNAGFYRLLTAKISSEHCFVIFIIHHIVFDGVSFQLFLKEISDRYNGVFVAEKEGLSYAEYALDSVNPLTQTKNKAYLKNILSKLNTLNYLERSAKQAYPFTQVYPDKNLLNEKKETRFFYIGKKTHGKLELIAQQLEVTPFALMAYAYAQVIHELVQEEPFAIGLTVHGRSSSSVKSTLGLFSQRTVLDLQGIGMEPSLTTIQAMQKNIFNCLENMQLSNYDFEEINTLCSSKNLATSQFHLVYQNHEKESICFNDLHLSVTTLRNSYFSCDVTDVVFVIENQEDQMELEVISNQTYIPSEFISSLAERFMQKVEELVSPQCSSLRGAKRRGNPEWS